MRRLVAVLGLAALFTVSTARADEERGALLLGRTPEPPASRWYGWQTLVTDGASTLVMVAGIAAENGPVAYTGMGGFVFGAPIVHISHGNPGRGIGSFALRVGLPLLGFVAGYSAFHHTSRSGEWLNFSGLGEGLLLGLSGVGACVSLDAAVFAYESPPEVRDAQRRLAYTPTWTPQVGYVRGGAVAGLGGTF